MLVPADPVPRCRRRCVADPYDTVATVAQKNIARHHRRDDIFAQAQPHGTGVISIKIGRAGSKRSGKCGLEMGRPRADVHTLKILV
jgi:hypothetical protein